MRRLPGTHAGDPVDRTVERSDRFSPTAGTRLREVRKTHERAPESPANYEEEVLSTDPFRATFTFDADGDALTVTVDEDVSVVDVTRERASESS